MQGVGLGEELFGGLFILPVLVFGGLTETGQSDPGLWPAVFVARMDRQSSTVGDNSAAKRAVSRLCSKATTDRPTAEKSSFVPALGAAARAGGTRAHRNSAIKKYVARFGMESAVCLIFFIVQ